MGAWLARGVRDRLTADRREGLVDHLGRLVGLRVGGGRVIRSVIGVGRQGVVCLAADGREASAAVKCPLLDYHRPWSFGAAEVTRARQQLQAEAQLMEAFGGRHRPFPRLFEVVYRHSPLHGARRELGRDPFVIMEHIEAPSVLELARPLSPPATERLLRRLVGQLAALQEELAAEGAVYLDLKPEHLLLQEDGELRVLDLGALHLEGRAGEVPHNLHYCGPVGAGVQLAARRALGRLLCELWTGRRWRQGARLAEAPEWLAGAVSGLLEDEEPLPWLELRRHAS